MIPIHIDDILLDAAAPPPGGSPLWGRTLGEITVAELIAAAQPLTIPPTTEIEEATNDGDDANFF